MTREEAIEILESQKNEHYKEELNEALDMAISALSAPSANIISIDQANAMIKSYVSHYEENEGEWIPVSERLPEYDEDIIITHKGTMGQPITSVSYFDGDFRTEDGEGYFIDVIAWMPLPEPYKKGE